MQTGAMLTVGKTAKNLRHNSLPDSSSQVAKGAIKLTGISKSLRARNRLMTDRVGRGSGWFVIYGANLDQSPIFDKWILAISGASAPISILTLRERSRTMVHGFEGNGPFLKAAAVGMSAGRALRNSIPSGGSGRRLGEPGLFHRHGDDRDDWPGRHRDPQCDPAH